MLNAPENSIGGTEDGAGNVISGNGSSGISIEGVIARANNVFGNLIGLDKKGEKAIGNGGDGVEIFKASDNIIGGIVGGRNTISGNSGHGVSLSGFRCQLNKVQGNSIGIKSFETLIETVDSLFLSNSANGVGIFDLANRNTIGGTKKAEGNIIWNEDKSGVVVGSARRNSILSNEICVFEKTEGKAIGIDLGDDGVTVNDKNNDRDRGPNMRQNFPIIREAKLIEGEQFLVVEGKLESKRNTIYLIQLFNGLQIGDVSCRGFIMDVKSVKTNSTGNAIFSGSISIEEIDNIFGSDIIYATATDPNGNTSEFSPGVEVVVE